MTTTTPTSSIALLARADLLLLLADALRPPVEARPRLIELQSSDLDALVDAAQLSDRADLTSALTHLLEIAREFDAHAWSDEFNRLFEGAMVCPLNETAFIRRDKGAIIGDLAGYYRAFGWTPANHGGEKPDHILTELEFLAVLMTMAARADAAAAEITLSAIDSFVANHLGDWIIAAAERLGMWTSADYYRQLSQTLSAAWQSISMAHHWPPPVELPSIRAAEEDSPYDCGAPDAEAPIHLTVHPRAIPQLDRPAL